MAWLAVNLSSSEPGDLRRAKRVKWFSRVELPYEYNWINDGPMGGTSGINNSFTECSRDSTNPGIPKNLNRLKCLLVSTKFR